MLVFAPGHHLAVGEQRVVAFAAGRDLLDAGQAGHLGGPVAGHEPRFGLAGGAFEALFLVAALAEFGGAPGPHGAVVAQRHRVGVGDRDFLDFGEARTVTGWVSSLLQAVAELALVARAPRPHGAVAQQRQAELEAGLDLGHAGQPVDRLGGVLEAAGEARAELFGGVQAPVQHGRAAVRFRAAFAGRRRGRGQPCRQYRQYRNACGYAPPQHEASLPPSRVQFVFYTNNARLERRLAGEAVRFIDVGTTNAAGPGGMAARRGTTMADWAGDGIGSIGRALIATAVLAIVGLMAPAALARPLGSRGAVRSDVLPPVNTEGGCEFIAEPVSGVCMLPFPDDYYTVADPTSHTGRRVHFSDEMMPAEQATGSTSKPRPTTPRTASAPGR